VVVEAFETGRLIRNWDKVLGITEDRADRDGLQVTVPRDKLNLQGKRSIQILIETINEKWEGQDVLPRKGTWQSNLPK
jgi:hypothetical protein